MNQMLMSLSHDDNGSPRHSPSRRHGVLPVNSRTNSLVNFFRLLLDVYTFADYGSTNRATYVDLTFILDSRSRPIMRVHQPGVPPGTTKYSRDVECAEKIAPYIPRSVEAFLCLPSRQILVLSL
jgi:hypothetical protein